MWEQVQKNLRYIQNTDWEIIGLIRWRSPLDNISSLVEKINNNQRVKLVYGDIRDPLSIDEVIKNNKPDYLFHLAAQSYPLTSFTSPLDTLETNIQGTTIVLEALRKYSKECITHVCASSEVFGRVTKGMDVVELLSKLPADEEDWPLNNIYISVEILDQ